MYILTALQNRVVGGLSISLDSDQEGQGMVEYALIIVFIAVVVILAVTLFGGQTKNLYSSISAGFR